MQRPSQQVAHPSRFARSRVTNGRLPPGIDGRSLQARRWRDLVRGYEADFIITTEVDRGLVHMAATLTLTLEGMQAAQLRGEAVDAGELTRLAGQQRRVLADLRRKGEAAVPTPISIHEHLARSAAALEPEEGGD